MKHTPRKNKIVNMLLTGSFLLLAATSFPAFSVVDPNAQSPNQTSNFGISNFISDRIIVKYKDNIPANGMATLSASHTSQLSQVANINVKHMRQLATGAHLVKLQEKMSSFHLNRIILNMMADPNIEYAEVDQLLQPMAIPSDPRYNEQWHYFESAGGLNLPDAWDISTGQGVVVGVLDTGYRPHPDLNANLLPGYDMINDADVAQDGDGRDADAIDPGDWRAPGTCDETDQGSSSSWHGTHVAGTVAAVTNNGIGIAGVAYGAKVTPIRVLGRCGGYTSDIADGIIWGAGGSVSGVPTNPNPAQVLNLSLGGRGNCGTTTQAAINTARSLGATVVTSAGNSNANSSGFTPANCNGVITVASVGRDGGKAYYSNFGNSVDVAAPGGEMNSTAINGVLSTLNSGTQGPAGNNYAFYQGTSMAAPHVAGAAALLYAADENITPDEVENILKNTARSFPETCNQCGTGIVDALASLNALVSNPTPTPTPTPLPGDNVLLNNEAKPNLSASTNQALYYTMEVPSGARDLSFNLSGGSGDADIYVRFGAEPTLSNYDCRPYRTGNNEACDFSSPQSGTYHVMVHAYSSFSGVSLIGSYTEGGSGNSDTINESGLSAGRRDWLHFSIEVPTGATELNANISGGSGDADLYVRFGSQATTSQYECRPYLTGNNETCTISNPQAGTWYVSVRAYSAFSGLSLFAESN